MTTTQGVVDLFIVEDNPHDLELILRALKKGQIETHMEVAKDGVEALDFVFCRGRYAERAAAQVPKVILLDHKLPKVDGMEVLRQIKSDKWLKVIPVVMLTSSQQERDILESYNLGVNSYIVKPVDYSKFSETIAHLGRYWLLLNQTSR